MLAFLRKMQKANLDLTQSNTSCIAVELSAEACLILSSHGFQISSLLSNKLVWRLRHCRFIDLPIDCPEKVNCRSQILVHEYWAILHHFGSPVLFAYGSNQHVLKDINITFLGNTGTPETFQYSPILGCSSIWDLKYTFSDCVFRLCHSNLHNYITAFDQLCVWLFKQEGSFPGLLVNTKSLTCF